MNNNIAGTYSLPGIIFGSSGTSVRTIGGNTIRFFDNAGTDPYISNDSSATHVFNLNIEGDGDAADPLLININSSGGLTFNGTINNQGSTINVQGSTGSSATVTMNGVISGGGGLYKANANTTLVLAGNNTYTGQTTIDGGTISITNANSLGTGTLQIGIAGAYSRLLVNSNSSRTQSLVIRDSATNTIIEVASGQTFTNSGTLSGTGSSTKFGKHGAGTLILTGSGSTYAGQMQIGGGTVILGQSGSFGNSTSTSTRAIDLGLYVDDATSSENVSLLASNNVTISNSIYVAPNGGTRTIGLSGSGTNTFNNEFFLAGDLTVSVGTAAADQVNMSGNIINTGGLIKTGSGNLVLSGANTYTGTTTISAGTLSVGAGGTSGALGTVNVTNNATLVFNRTGAITVTNLISGTGAVQVTNAVLTLSGANTYQGTTTIRAGATVRLGHASGLGATKGNTSISGGGALDLNGQTGVAENISGTGTGVSTSGFIYNSSATAASLSGNVALTGGNNHVYVTNGTITLSGVVSDNAATPRLLTKLGSGTLFLYGANTYSGGLNLGAGTVVITTSRRWAAARWISAGARWT